MGRYEKIAFVVVSVSAYVAFLLGLVRLLILTLLILFNYFVYRIVIATEVRIIEGVVEVGFGLFLLSIRRPIAGLINDRLESDDGGIEKEQAD
jgi:hypothetical protein